MDPLFQALTSLSLTELFTEFGILLYIAYFIQSTAFISTDFIIIRTAALGSSLIIINHYLFAATAIEWPTIFWESILVLINGRHTWNLIKKRIGIHLTKPQKEVYLKFFKSLPIGDFRELIQLAKYSEISAGTILTLEGQPVTHLILIYEGQAKVVKRGEFLVDLEKFKFIGEMAFTTHHPASANVTAATHMKIFTWPVSELEALFHQDPALKMTFSAALGIDMATKLE